MFLLCPPSVSIPVDMQGMRFRMSILLLLLVFVVPKALTKAVEGWNAGIVTVLYSFIWIAAVVTMSAPISMTPTPNEPLFISILVASGRLPDTDIDP